MRVSKIEPKWTAKPWDTRAVIAGYYVDYLTAEGAPTAEQVLAIAEPTLEQIARRDSTERGFDTEGALQKLRAGIATSKEVQSILAYLLRLAGA